MSSPITPAGPTLTSNVQEPLTTPATPDSTPAASATGATVTEGMKLQEDGVDKALQNVPQRPVTTTVEDPAAATDSTTDSPPVLLGSADLAAKQLKSAAQRQTDTTATTTSTDGDSSGSFPVVGDIAVNKAQILSTSGVTDILAEATGDLGAALAPLSNLATFLAPLFQFDFGAFFAQQFFIQTWMNTSMRAFSNSQSSSQKADEKEDQPVVVRKWVELMMIGGKLTEVVTEQFKTVLKTITKVEEKRTVTHTFTKNEVSKLLDGMQKKGLLPPEIPGRDKICENIANAAQQTLDRLNRTDLAGDSQPGF